MTLKSHWQIRINIQSKCFSEVYVSPYCNFTLKLHLNKLKKFSNIPIYISAKLTPLCLLHIFKLKGFVFT